MKPTAQDFARLRWSLALLVAFAALGAGAVAAALHFSAQGAVAYKQALTQRNDIQSRLARANEEEADIRQKIGRYQLMAARGYIGQEHRLEWVERIAQIKNARRLIDIQYELSPQQPLGAAALPVGNAAGGHEFMTSTMKLQMQLLHEEDLLGFLGDLGGSVQAFLHVRDCNVERLPKTGNERGGAQLKADCDIEWITLREKK